MDNFKVIYQILRALERAMDYPEVDYDLISYEALNISYERWVNLIIMLKNDGYIDGVSIIKRIGAGDGIKLNNPKITLKGIEYLSENSTMKKAANLAKGIIDIVK